MKVIMKKVTALILSISLVMSFTGVAFAAGEQTYSFSEAELAAIKLASVMETIAADYNGEVDYDKMVNAAFSGIFSTLDEHSEYFYTMADFEKFIENIKPSRLMFGIVFQKTSDGKIKIRQIYEGSSAIDAGLVEGDILISANGVNVSDMTVSQAIEEMNKITGNTVNVVFLRDNSELKVTLEKRELANKTVFVYKVEEMLEESKWEKSDEVRIVQITAVGEKTAEEMKTVIEDLKNQGIKRIILDLRGNEGGYVEIGISICKMLTDRGPVLSKVEGDNRILTYFSAQAEAPFSEVVVLTDDYTASAAEMITACLKDRGSVIVGQQTYGKASIQNIYYTYDSAYKLTIGEYLSSKGIKINKVGIVPDIYVELPEFLYYTLETSGEDIINLKKILKYCGYEIGSIDETYDDITKASVIKAKTELGLEANEKIDVYIKDTINEMYVGFLEQKDMVLEEACNHMFN